MNIPRALTFGVLLAASLAGSAPATITVVTAETWWLNTVPSPQVAGFEGILGPVNTQYPWVSFSAFNGGSPDAVTQFPHQGQNSLFTASHPSGGGGGFAADLIPPVNAVAFWSDDVQYPGTTVTLRDAQMNVLGSYDLLNSGGGMGPVQYGFIGFRSDSTPIARVEVSINPQDAIWFDDFEAGTVNVASVPGPPIQARSWGRLKGLFE